MKINAADVDSIMHLIDEARARGVLYLKVGDLEFNVMPPEGQFSLSNPEDELKKAEERRAMERKQDLDPFSMPVTEYKGWSEEELFGEAP